MTTEEELALTKRYLAWVTGGDTGVSSATIFHVCAPGVARNLYHKYDAPHDADDFGRCRRLINLFPEWEACLPEVAERCEAWAPLAKHWQALCALYDAGKLEDLDRAVLAIRARARRMA